MVMQKMMPLLAESLPNGKMLYLKCLMQMNGRMIDPWFGLPLLKHHLYFFRYH